MKSRRQAAAIPKQRPRPSSDATEPEGEHLRDTGIRIIGDMPWGTHICSFYESVSDLLDLAACYFRPGLKNREYCIWAISDPIDRDSARQALAKTTPDLADYEAQIEILDGCDWYLNGGEFDLQRITGGWRAKMERALEQGYEGLRICGNAFWIATNHWPQFRLYEEELDHALEHQKMIVLCTYPLHATRAVDLLDVARAHQCTVARRGGAWEFLETPELTQARREIARLSGALDVLSKPFPGRERLTPRERLALAQIIRGATSKEAARNLGISPRTMEFHRANILRKLKAKNTVDLVGRVFEETR